MKVYIDDSNETVNILQTVASASTMISSVASEAREYILSKFPKDFFKHVYIDTSETVVQQKMNNKYNPTANKIPYPSMGITPEVSLDDPIGGMQKTMHLSSPNLYLRKDIKRTYNKIIVDPKQKFGIYYTSDYITTNFNFKIITNSFIQNVDTMFFLQSKFQKDFFQFLNNKYLQSEIPKSFIKVIADLNNWNLDNNEDIDKLRLYLIGTSIGKDFIKKRVNLATGKQCFFINNNCNLLTLFTDLSAPSSVNRESQVESEYEITFRLQVSTWLPNAFVLTIDKSALQRLNKKTIYELENSTEQQEDGFVSMSFTFNEVLTKKDTINFTDASGTEQTGILVYYDTFMYDVTKPIPKFSIIDNLGEEFKKIHSYAINKLHIDPTSLMKIVMKTPFGDLEKNNICKIDYNTIVVEILKNLHTDIKISVYVNRLLYESIKKAMIEDIDYFNNNTLTTIYANIAGFNECVRVKSFINNNENYSSDIEKSVRIKTPYGIGYLSLLDDDDTDSYKICVGYSDDGDPIIKKFEIINN